MSALLNVNRDVEDEFFRYKMPRLVAKIEGKGNGIKTVLVNMSDIAKSLYRQPTFPTKYFGCELGAQTQFDVKHDRYIVNGQHDAAKLQDLLDGFIRKFVLCANCHNPETDLLVKPRRNEVQAKCKACGHVYTIDPLHRLTTFILKNPPEGKKTAKKAVPVASSTNKAKFDSPERKEQPQQAELVDVVDGSKLAVVATLDNDDDWGSDIGEVNLVADPQLSEAVKNMVLDVDVAEKSVEERANLFHAFVKQQLLRDQIVGHEREIVAEADRMDIRDKAVVILLEVLMADPKSYLDRIRRFRKAFLHFTLENGRAQRYLLGALEKLIGEHRDFYLPRVSKLLLELYEADILSEEAIFDWAEKGPSKRYVDRVLSKLIHENAAKMVEWLRTASGDSEDEDENEHLDEKAIDLSSGMDPVHVNGTAQLKCSSSKVGGVTADDSDIDIDDI